MTQEEAESEEPSAGRGTNSDPPARPGDDRISSEALRQALPGHKHVRRYLSRREKRADHVRLARLAATEDYEVGEIIARGAESLLHLGRCGTERVCIKTIRSHFGKAVEHMHGDDQVSEKLTDISYKAKVRHLTNEFSVGQALQSHEAPGELPVVRIYALRKVKRFLMAAGHDLIMEYVDGADMGDRHALQAMGLPQKIDCFYQTAQALRFMHHKKFVHLDMKPSNIMMSKGRVKLIDFGVTVSTGHNPKAVTGTAGYLSPEQIVQDYLDEGTDIFALGVTFAVIFGGHPLRQHQADIQDRTVRMEARYQLENIDEPMVMDIPEIAHVPKLIELISRCTIPHRGKRINSASTVINTIRRVARELGTPLTDVS